MFSNFDNNSEIEAKVCFQYNNKKVSNVNIHEFQGIKHELLQKYPHEQYFQTVDIYDGVRKVDNVFEKKTRVDQIMHSTSIPHLAIKWTHSREEKVADVDLSGNVPLLTRRKDVCKIKYNNTWDIYLVMVNGYNCEIEIEYTGKMTSPPLQDYKMVDDFIESLFKHRFETKIVKQYNMLTSNKPHPYLNWCVNKPINLKFDMWRRIAEGYGFYLKMDGIRYLLYSNHGKLYALNETYRILVFNNTRIPHNTVLDAEYVNETFHVFDVLFINGNDLRDRDMTFRNDVLKNIPYDLNMEYTEISTEYNLIWHYTICGLPAYTDGIVFFPLYEPYKNKCTFKYKPAELLTIDFLVQKDGLYAIDDAGDLVVFKGNTMYPYTFELGQDWQINTITEFQYKGGQFHPMRIRHDKVKPNYIGVALDNWDDINNPIDLSSFVQNILSCRQ